MKIVRIYTALLLFTMFVFPPASVVGAELCSVIQTDCCCKPEPVSCCDDKAEISKVNYHNPECKCVITEANVVSNDNILFFVKQQHNEGEILPAKTSDNRIQFINEKYSIISKLSLLNFQPKLYILNSSFLN